jgi:PKD repeat protein
VDASNVSSEDDSSVIAYGGDKIGVLWSNQTSTKDGMWFAEHTDGAPESAWTPSRAAIQGPGSADDHMNLKALQTDSGGRVYAAVKTSFTGSAPLILLLVRDPQTGDWESHVFGRGTDCHNRPIVVIDEESRMIHMFATGPQAPDYTCAPGGGAIYEKVSPLDEISFKPGYGTLVMQDTSSATMHDVTASKQNVTSSTGLLVLAVNLGTKFYWHHYDALTPAPPPPPPPAPPVADFTGTPTSGTAPVTVAFTDASSGTPTSWSWNFGDGTSASSQNPTHTYASPGTYTVSLTATNAGGSNTKTLAGYITVAAPPIPTEITVAASADAQVSSTKPNENFGASTILRIRANAERSFVRFTVSGIAGRVVRSAKLRLFVALDSKDGTITWNNAPAISGTAVAAAGRTALGTWVELDVKSVVNADGTFSFALRSASSNPAEYESREGAHAPQLVVTVD